MKAKILEIFYALKLMRECIKDLDEMALRPRIINGVDLFS
jgi:hypothetical protein